jgi:hypothetical protein
MFVRLSIHTSGKEELHYLGILEGFKVDIVYWSNLWNQHRQHCEAHFD